MNTLYTIGHAGMGPDEFLGELLHREILTVVDIRSEPSSHLAPWTNRDDLRALLADVDMRYLWGGKALGEKSPLLVTNEAFQAPIERLLQLEGNVVLMGARENPKNSSRASKVCAWLLREHGVDALHIGCFHDLLQSDLEREMPLDWVAKPMEPIP